MRHLQGIVLALAVLSVSSCNGLPASEPVGEEQEQEIKAALRDRSFRQFSPSRDANPRRSVILDFFDGLEVWSQYAEDNRAVSEWIISSADYRIESSGDPSEITIYFIDPNSAQTFPTQCENCIRGDGLSISIRDVFDEDSIAFRLNDPDNVLPLPFPVFHAWTMFSEDEYFD